MEIRKELTEVFGSEELRRKYEVFLSNTNLSPEQIDELLTLIQESIFHQKLSSMYLSSESKDIIDMWLKRNIIKNKL